MTVSGWWVSGFLPNALVADSTLPLTVSGLIVVLGRPGPPLRYTNSSQQPDSLRRPGSPWSYLLVLPRPATYLAHHLLPTELLTVLSQPSRRLGRSNARSSCDPGTGDTLAASVLVLSRMPPCFFVGVCMHTFGGLCTTPRFQGGRCGYVCTSSLVAQSRC